MDFKPVALAVVIGDAHIALNGGDDGTGKLQGSGMGLDAQFAESAFQWFQPHHIAGNEIGWSSTPCMVPVEVGLEDRIPGLQTYTAAQANHIVPAPLACGIEQRHGIFVDARFEKGIHQELGTIYATCHSARLYVVAHGTEMFGRHQLEC